MRMLRLACVLGAACGSDPIEPGVARDAFERSNMLLHELHLEAFDLPAWPADDHARPCQAGGRIVMQSQLSADGVPTQLGHAFESCSSDGWTFDGDLDYLDISQCADGSFTYRMAGNLEILGHGSCRIDASEMCGVVSGTACGTKL